jgi:uncharacterized protein (DUF1800 family)
MAQRPLAIVLSQMVLVLFLVAGNATAQNAPALTSAASRKTQGGKNYDVALPLTGGSGIEPRGDGTLVLVLTFDQPVSGADVAVAAGKGTLSGAPALAGNTVTVKLVNVPNAQELRLRVTNITPAAGGAMGASTVALRTLEGDVNADGVVNDSDLSIVKSLAVSNAAVSGFNFRADANVSGAISGADVTRVKSRIGTSVAGNITATANTAPELGAPANQKIFSGVTSRNVAVAVGDRESSTSSLAVQAKSDNQAILPDSGIAVSGTGSTRILSFTPAAGTSGTVHVVLNVSDGLQTASQTFTVEVAGQPTLYIANMTPQGVAISTASGFATLQLSADETFAVLNFSYSNLSTPEVAEHVHGPADPGQNGGIIFDIDTSTINADGSRTWTFVPVGQETVADQVNALKQGRTYINIHTSKYPQGEIRGQFVLSTGSQTFTPPPPPPALPSGPPTSQDACRFLQQATFGANDQLLAQVQAMGFDAWLNQQFQMPPTLVSPILAQRQALGEALNDNHWTEGWWNVSIAAPDQLRQRVAFALSELLVVSQDGAGLAERPTAIANYYDMLLKDAFANYRTILEDVTLNPEMGIYLNMRGNVKANPSTGTNPNENYAREILQLFSIGLNKLQPDGTLKLDAQGLPMATYDQSVVVGLARVFTGWNWHQNGTSNNPASDYINPMTLVAGNHESGTKQILDGVVLPANQGGAKDLADLLNQIFNHPNTGPFVCRQLIQRLVTDNPSPAYVYRVAQKFADNGQGVRGDMKAVIKAILTDYEARSTEVMLYQGFGHLKEPLIRTTQVIRAFHPKSNSGYWRIPETDFELGQSPCKAPTVFNFFEPMYVFPGALASAGLVAPEFQITTDTTAIAASNFLETGIRSSFKGNDVTINLATERALANNPGALVDRINTLLMAGQMSTAMRDRIIQYINTIPLDGSGTDTLTRAQGAVHLVATSPEFSVQK